MSGFIENRITELPRWLAGRQGRAFAIAQGAQQDLQLKLTISGIKQRWPTTCDDAALDDVGKGFQIERYPGESSAEYRGRLLSAWESWEKSGTPAAIEDSIEGWGVEDVHVYRDFDGTFGEGQWYSRFWVMLGPNMPWKPLICGSFKCGDGSTCGSTATAREISNIKRQILKWKSYYGYPVKIILHFFDGDGPDTVPLCGINLRAPFVCGSAHGVTPQAYCTWRIGKTTRDTLNCAPFVCGEFYDGSGSYFDR